MQNPVRTGYPPSLSEGLPQKLFDFINDCTKKTEKKKSVKRKIDIKKTLEICFTKKISQCTIIIHTNPIIINRR